MSKMHYALTDQLSKISIKARIDVQEDLPHILWNLVTIFCYELPPTANLLFRTFAVSNWPSEENYDPEATTFDQ